MGCSEQNEVTFNTMLSYPKATIDPSGQFMPPGNIIEPQPLDFHVNFTDPPSWEGITSNTPTDYQSPYASPKPVVMAPTIVFQQTSLPVSTAVGAGRTDFRGAFA
jgi:hypothetical protein